MIIQEIINVFGRVKKRSEESGHVEGELFPINSHTLGLAWEDSKPIFFIKSSSPKINDFKRLELYSFDFFSAKKDLGRKAGGETSAIFCRLNNLELQNFFFVLIESIFSEMNLKNGDSALIFLKTLKNWKSLFLGEQKKGLSEQQVRGLYGELFFMKSFYNHFQYYPIEHWKGLDGEPKDFEFNHFSVEVKTSRAGRQEITINGLDQLSQNSGSLYLFVYQITESSVDGSSLAEIIQEISGMLPEESNTRFWHFLVKYGFNPMNTESNIKLSIRSEFAYNINNEFPRISSDVISASTSSRVKRMVYSLDISGLSPLESPYDTLRDNLNPRSILPD